MTHAHPIALACSVAITATASAQQAADLFQRTGDGTIMVDAAALSSDALRLELDTNLQTTWKVTDRTAINSDDVNVWRGESPDGGWFSIASAGGVLHAIIETEGDGRYELRYNGDGTDTYRLLRVDTIDFPPCEGAVIPAVAGRQANAGAHAADAIVPRHTGSDEQHTTGEQTFSLGGGSQIDVLIVYTAEARIGAGGTNAILALAQNSIAVTNQAYLNSQIPGLDLRLVHAEEISYSETDNSGTDLTRLRGTTDGFMDGVHALRESVGADLVSLLLDDIGSSCGRAYLAPFNPGFGFSVVDADCAVGNLSFPHEIGHNMGAAHDEPNAGSSIYDYGFGWRWFGNNGQQYRSVMSYSPGQRIPYFSNPAVSYVGQPTGTASADNARVHELTAPSVASFTDPVSACVADTNGDGSLTPADFNAWISAFNAGAPACDQNGDAACTPADFNAWISNFNAGC